MLALLERRRPSTRAPGSGARRTPVRAGSPTSTRTGRASSLFASARRPRQPVLPDDAGGRARRPGRAPGPARRCTCPVGVPLQARVRAGVGARHRGGEPGRAAARLAGGARRRPRRGRRAGARRWPSPPSRWRWSSSCRRRARPPGGVRPRRRSGSGCAPSARGRNGRWVRRGVEWSRIGTDPYGPTWGRAPQAPAGDPDDLEALADLKTALLGRRGYLATSSDAIDLHAAGPGRVAGPRTGGRTRPAAASARAGSTSGWSTRPRSGSTCAAAPSDGRGQRRA